MAYFVYRIIGQHYNKLREGDRGKDEWFEDADKIVLQDLNLNLETLFIQLLFLIVTNDCDILHELEEKYFAEKYFSLPSGKS